MASTRKYEQRLRAASAQQTRRRILDAVYARLREAPAEPLSIDRVAQLAGVARPTIYVTFGSRAGLFDAVGADLLQRGGFDSMLRAAAHPDARAALHGAIDGIVRMYATNRDEIRVLSSMAILDAVAGGAVRRLEQGRADGMATLADRLATHDALRPDIDAARATDVLWLLTSFDSFDLLYTGRRLSADEAARTLTDTADRSLCRDR